MRDIIDCGVLHSESNNDKIENEKHSPSTTTDATQSSY